MAKTILSRGVLKSFTVIQKDVIAITTLKMKADFTPAAHESLGCGDLIFDGKDRLRQHCRQWGLTQELLGAKLHMLPEQTDLFNNKGLEFDSLMIDSMSVLRPKTEEVLRITFDVTVERVTEDMLVFFEAIKTGQCKITITPGNKTKQKEVENLAEQHGLFGRKKARVEGDDDADEGGDTGEEEGSEE